MFFLLILVQAAAPDIEFDFRGRARSVEVQQKGETKLEVWAEPEGGSQGRTTVQPRPRDANRLKNVEIEIHAEARIAPPQQIPEAAETASPQ
jgi:hypothetical protein